MNLYSYFFSCLLLLCSYRSSVQGPAIIQWHFASELFNKNEAMIRISAIIKPGWHTYSQFLEEGGPYPTRIIFTYSEDFILLGGTEEKGKPTTVYDDIYDMHITKYAGKVDFVQHVKLHRPKVELKGKITYMVCNNETCLPQERDFNITIEVTK